MISKAHVSVIIPCYRCSTTIVRAVESIARQTVRPVEVILIDDSSGDGTVAVLRQLQKKHDADWIKVIEQKENGGPSTARNAGWELASQPYLAFLDADDSWHPQKIEIQYKYMCSHLEVAMTGHACQKLKSHEQSDNSLCHKINDAQFHSVSINQLFLSNRFSTRAVMLRREIPLRFKSGKYHGEDYLLWLQICFKYGPAYNSHLPLAYLYKAEYGEGGLGGQLWVMELGELDTYRQLRNKKIISTFKLIGLWIYSLIKFLRRVLLTFFRRLTAQ